MALDVTFLTSLQRFWKDYRHAFVLEYHTVYVVKKEIVRISHMRFTLPGAFINNSNSSSYPNFPNTFAELADSFNKVLLGFAVFECAQPLHASLHDPCQLINEGLSFPTLSSPDDAILLAFTFKHHGVTSSFGSTIKEHRHDFVFCGHGGPKAAMSLNGTPFCLLQFEENGDDVKCDEIEPAPEVTDLEDPLQAVIALKVMTHTMVFDDDGATGGSAAADEERG
ncbi:hypothetical protein HPB50_021949 [Hyalomma asiaticum]|uniref:Uncharacterized protein n=1 Tax=Hyalomma asiaticum TaxID=266040 RepID=A0ACB7SJZ1_HYAAI|nr:hypothetical protein HPB50_021949 [Hyalomma asiaticum]